MRTMLCALAGLTGIWLAATAPARAVPMDQITIFGEAPDPGFPPFYYINITFDMPAQPVPDAVYPTDVNPLHLSSRDPSPAFMVSGVSTVVRPYSGPAETVPVDWYFLIGAGDIFAGGLSGLDPGVVFDDFPGDQLFSGPVSAPTLLTGTFAARYEYDYRAFGDLTVTITAIPEPAAAAPLAIGLGALAWLRRRRPA
jgi:hypothetical protein